MRASTILKFAAAACVLALVACGALLFGKVLHIGFHYPDAGQYTAGGATLEGGVKHLDIDWVDGAVNLAYHAGDTVEISETAPKPISEGDALRWWLDGDTLRIRYAKSGKLMFHGLRKALTVTLPEGTALGEVDVEATSADVNIPRTRAERAAFGMTSGNLTAALEGAKAVSASNTSGDIALDQVGASEDVRLSTTSGDIRAALADVGALTISSTSGNVQARFAEAGSVTLSSTSGTVSMDGEAVKRANLDTTSGDIAACLGAFDALSLDTTSGNVTAALPAEPGYRAGISTTSGRVDYTVPLTRDGGDYTCGDGSGSLRIHATSGNVMIADVNA